MYPYNSSNNSRKRKPIQRRAVWKKVWRNPPRHLWVIAKLSWNTDPWLFQTKVHHFAITLLFSVGLLSKFAQTKAFSCWLHEFSKQSAAEQKNCCKKTQKPESYLRLPVHHFSKNSAFTWQTPFKICANESPYSVEQFEKKFEEILRATFELLPKP